LNRGTREATDEALSQFYEALQIDPDFASAHAMAAWCHFWRKVNGWMGDRVQEIAEGARLARRAVELGQDDAVALTRSGHALGHLAADLDGGIALIDKALLINPNLAAAWFLGGFLRLWTATRTAPRRTSNARCVSARSTPRCIECRREWRWRICLPDV
jgi:hypothetical protein